MSAFICDEKTISAIVKGFEIYNVEFKAEGYQRPIQIIIDLAEIRQGVGQALLDQNYQSVNCRYNEADKTPKFQYKDVEVNAGIIYGCIQCYEYQACETFNYFESDLHRSIENLKEAMLKRFIKQANMKCPYGYDGHDILEC